MSNGAIVWPRKGPRELKRSTTTCRCTIVNAYENVVLKFERITYQVNKRSDLKIIVTIQDDLEIPMYEGKTFTDFISFPV